MREYAALSPTKPLTSVPSWRSARTPERQGIVVFERTSPFVSSVSGGLLNQKTLSFNSLHVRYSVGTDARRLTVPGANVCLTYVDIRGSEKFRIPMASFFKISTSTHFVNVLEMSVAGNLDFLTRSSTHFFFYVFNLSPTFGYVCPEFLL